jgi:hypothetical protein
MTTNDEFTVIGWPAHEHAAVDLREGLENIERLDIEDELAYFLRQLLDAGKLTFFEERAFGGRSRWWKVTTKDEPAGQGVIIDDYCQSVIYDLFLKSLLMFSLGSTAKSRNHVEIHKVHEESQLTARCAALKWHLRSSKSAQAIVTAFQGSTAGAGIGAEFLFWGSRRSEGS